jgi:hypothetical protein
MGKLIGLNPPAPPHVLRMAEEADEIGIKLLAIENFENTNIFKSLDAFDQHLLQAQFATMQAYLRILLLRIERAAITAH